MNQTSQFLSWAADVLTQESESLLLARERLDGQFEQAVQTILSMSGKVVVSGLGKSGHVARKLAATLSSTGTSAFFLHPAEALHGDLGMLRSGDCLIAIAYGGETAETIAVATYAKRLEVPVIALTGKTSSSLAQLADLVIDGAVEREACPLNLAPTSSTTLAMALGDALAVALMRARGFAQQDFAAVHPSGSLGRRLSRVVDHLRTDIVCLKPDDGFARILDVITDHNYGIAAVVDGSQLIGAITDGDLRRALIRSEALVFQKKAVDLMSAKPLTIRSHQFAIDAIQLMERKSVNTLFVKADNNSDDLLGIVRMYDLLQAKVV